MSTYQRIAKITIPAVPEGIVQRERLFCLLDDCRKKPVIWLSGPGGSGKTTLIITYLQSRALPCLWYQVDGGDGDIGSFFYYLGIAAAKAAPSRRKPLPRWSPEYGLGVPTFTRGYFTALFGQLKSPYVIVFDNYQEAPQESAFHEVVSTALSIVPAGCAVFVLSRIEPPPAFARLRAERAIAAVDWQHTRFTLEETRAMAELSSQTFSDVQVEDMHRQTEGWVAGLVLMMAKAHELGIFPHKRERFLLDDIFAYFTSELFKKADPEMQAFLIKTAVLPFLTPEMAGNLTGMSRPGRIMRELTRRHFFITRHNPGYVYQYHPLFQEFLSYQGRELLPPDEMLALQRRAAGILSESGFVPEAVNLFLKAGQWNEGVALICREAPQLFAQGRSEFLRVWLESIPDDLLRSNPDLLYWKGACLMPVNPHESRDSFRNAFDIFARKNDRQGMFLSWSGGADVSLYEGEFTPMDQWLSLLEGMHVEENHIPSGEIGERVVMSIFNAMAFRQPGHPDIATWSERTVILMQGNADINFRLLAGINLITYYLWHGTFDRATFLNAQIEEMALAKNINPLIAITVKLKRTLFAFFTAAGESGVKAALEALQMAEKTDIHVWDAHILGHGIANALSMGDSAMAHTLFEKLQSKLAEARRFDIGYYHALRAWEDMLRGDFPAACQHLKLTLDHFYAIGFWCVYVAALNGMVEVLRQMGKADEAQASLAQAFTLSSGTKSAYLEFLCLLNGVQLALDDGDKARALTSLRTALALGKKQGYANMWLMRTASMIRICETALENDIEVDYVREIIRKLRLIPEKAPIHLEHWPWPLRLYAFGRFELMKHDGPVVFTGKVQKKPLELLKALIACDGENVPIDSLTDALWPDAAGDFAHHAFETTLYRLRKMLGNNGVLSLEAGVLSLDPRYCWVDTRAFTRACDEIYHFLNKSKERQNGEDMAHLFEKAAGLYRGHFLPADGDQPWTIWMREHLRSRFLTMLKKAGAYWEGREQWDQAVAWYRRGLRADSLAEEFYQRLMVCYQAQGQRAEAVRTYQLCRSMLAGSFNLAPSPKTEDIYRRIIQK